MKIRTDFVTNSSSSSFVLVVCVTDKNEEVFSVKSSTYRKEAERIRDRNPAARCADITSKDALMRLLGELGFGYNAINTLKKNMPAMKDTERIDISLVWDSHGESSGCTVHNDCELKKKAEAFLNSKGEEHEKAKATLAEHLDNTPVYAEGAWVNETWPIAFFGDDEHNARYGWDEYRNNIDKLAKMIVEEKFSGDDLGVETLTIFPAEKRAAHHAELIVDGKRDILKLKRPKKPAAKKREPVVLVPLETVENEKMQAIDLRGYVFSYENVDQIPENFYRQAIGDDGKILIPKACREKIGSFTVTVNYRNDAAELIKLYNDPNPDWKEPSSFWPVYTEWSRLGSALSVPFPIGECRPLTPEQTRLRCAAFFRLMQLCTEKAVLKKLVDAYPKKKNGTFYKGRVLTIGWLYAVHAVEGVHFEEDRRWMYYAFQLFGKAEDDTQLNIGIRPIQPFTAEDFAGNDFIVSTNLFSELE